MTRGISEAATRRDRHRHHRRRGRRQRMAEKARQLNQDIARLTRMRDSLSHAASCTHTPLIDCPEFKSRISDGDAAG
jgi:hypothetical protein